MNNFEISKIIMQKQEKYIVKNNIIYIYENLYCKPDNRRNIRFLYFYIE